MQCPSCEFQNMPGSGRCARCGASLALATAAIDVHPPRAGRYQRTVPQFYGLRRAWANFLQGASRPFAAAFTGFEETSFDLGTLVRLLVPGWAHFARDRRERGIVFLAAYLSCLVPAIVLAGTGLGSMLLGLAFGVHVASAVDATVGRFADFGGRAAYSLFCGMFLLAVMYLPLGYAVSRIATPISITQSIAGFNRGDVLWYNRSAQIRPGELVYYEVPATTVAGRNARGQNANFNFQAAWINRVVALSGQTVSWGDGRLLVDGKPAPGFETVTLESQDMQPFTVPEGFVLIPPQMLIPAGAQLNGNIWQRVSLVRRGDVYGRVFLRSSPLWRFSWIK